MLCQMPMFLSTIQVPSTPYSFKALIRVQYCRNETKLQHTLDRDTPSLMIPTLCIHTTSCFFSFTNSISYSSFWPLCNTTKTIISCLQYTKSIHHIYQPSSNSSAIFFFSSSVKSISFILSPLTPPLSFKAFSN